MIAFVRGEIENISEDHAVIDVGGIGYTDFSQEMNWSFSNC